MIRECVEQMIAEPEQAIMTPLTPTEKAIIAEQLTCSASEITDIEVIKKGMTNRSVLFAVHGVRYIMRIPGIGTERLINRNEEALVYQVISGLKLCDDPVYIDAQKGYKITKYIEGARSCDPNNLDDLRRCMRKLRRFHEMKLIVPHQFDIFDKIRFYEELWNGQPSMYPDYKQTKANAFELRSYVEQQRCEYQLTHIDAVPDNFLFDPGTEGELSLQLMDREYAGMQDKHVDIAMFAIYSQYDKPAVDRLIDLYFENDGGCEQMTRIKIYCYIAICGLLWSNWCEYKRNCGVEFGEYSARQYRYAKEYYQYASEQIKLLCSDILAT